MTKNEKSLLHQIREGFSDPLQREEIVHCAKMITELLEKMIKLYEDPDVESNPEGDAKISNIISLCLMNLSLVVLNPEKLYVIYLVLEDLSYDEEDDEDEEDEDDDEDSEVTLQ